MRFVSLAVGFGRGGRHCACAAHGAAVQDRRGRVASRRLPVSQIAPQTIAFTDHKNDNLADRTSGLMRFDDWAQTRMVQKQFLGLFPSYDEPTLNAGGSAKPRKKRLHVYVAEARFALKRAAAAIDLGALRHAAVRRADRSGDQAQGDHGGRRRCRTRIRRAANHNPARRWCEGAGAVGLHRVDLQARRQAAARHRAGEQAQGAAARKYADTIEFQSELRVVPTAEIDDAGYRKLTGVDSPVVGALEQNIVHVNEVMQFGKLLAVFQRHPTDPNAYHRHRLHGARRRLRPVREEEGIRQRAGAAQSHPGPGASPATAPSTPATRSAPACRTTRATASRRSRTFSSASERRASTARRLDRAFARLFRSRLSRL